MILQELASQLFVLWVIFSVIVVLLHYRRLKGLWHEPVVAEPIVIFESDDWGAGPLQQAVALNRISQVLAGVKDHHNRCPVMTLGVTLSQPLVIDEASWQSGMPAYRVSMLDDEPLTSVLAAMRSGISQGVFAPQLHGMAHYWPESLMRRAQQEPAIRTWLATEHAMTEALPAELQSRWLDATELPATPLSAPEVNLAVEEETQAFARIFDSPPKVAVPPTFVWDSQVEMAWERQGVDYVVTPGRRYDGRGESGELTSSDDTPIRNGQSGHARIRYLVRDCYFEPMLGHSADEALASVHQQSVCGRPTLLEIHRFNFVGDNSDLEHACGELEQFLRRLLDAQPHVRFMSTEELGDAISTEADWLNVSFGKRCAVWLARIRADYRLWRVMKISLVGLLADLNQRLQPTLAADQETRS